MRARTFAADQMQNVLMDNACVYRSIKAIRTLIVDRNACLVQIVLKIKLVFKGNVQILVLAHVDKMLNVK
jgi:hypothetical protein